MYSSIYIFRVPRGDLEAFLTMQTEAARIYKKHGAIDDVTYLQDNLEEKYGCASFKDLLGSEKDELILIGISMFRNKEHHDKTMESIDSDRRINELYDEVADLLDLGTAIRGEFSRVL